MQGKLVKFEPLMINGEHSSYTGQYGTLYKFTVTMDSNGQSHVGTANSKKQQPSWKIGAVHTFDIDTVNTANGSYTNIKNLKSLDAASFGGGAKSNPSFIIQKIVENAIECSTLFFELNPEASSIENIDKLRDVFYNFCVKEKEETNRWIRLSALRSALQYNKAIPKPILAEGQTLSQWILSIAEGLVVIYKDTVAKQLESDK